MIDFYASGDALIVAANEASQASPDWEWIQSRFPPWRFGQSTNRCCISANRSSYTSLQFNSHNHYLFDVKILFDAEWDCIARNGTIIIEIGIVGNIGANRERYRFGLCEINTRITQTWNWRKALTCAFSNWIKACLSFSLLTVSFSST